jgi:hypothetical protein
MLKAVIRWLWSLGYYFDNELMASAIKSCFAAAISTDAEDGDFTGLDDDSQGAVVHRHQRQPAGKARAGHHRPAEGQGRQDHRHRPQHADATRRRPGSC